MLSLVLSLERIQQYTEIEQEEKPSESGIPPAYWPASGELRVENLSARYSAVRPSDPVSICGLLDLIGPLRVGLKSSTI